MEHSTPSHVLQTILQSLQTNAIDPHAAGQVDVENARTDGLTENKNKNRFRDFDNQVQKVSEMVRNLRVIFDKGIAQRMWYATNGPRKNYY